jgi:GTP cyclohydrolase IA
VNPQEQKPTEEEIERNIGRLLHHFDPEPSREGLRDTPRRYTRMMRELTEGYGQNPEDHMTFFEPEGDEMIVVRDIPLVSLCEHHLLPFTGKAHIAYIPDQRMAGLSKFKRICDVFAKRFQVQERLTSQIATSLDEILEPLGVLVMIEAEHMCMTIRGVQAPGSKTITSALKGVLLEKPEARAEAMALIARNGS